MASDPSLPSGYGLSSLLDARLRSAGPVDVYVSMAPPDRPARGYVCADIAPAMEWRNRICDGVSDVSIPFDLRCCGYTPTQALRTAELVQQVMRGWRPWPARPDLGRARLTSSTTVFVDDSVASDVRYVTTLHYVID